MADVLPVSLPPAEAVEYFRRKGVEPEGFDWRDVYAEEHARVFTVAKAMQLDVLTDIHAAVEEAIAEGTTFEQFKRELTPTLQEKGWWGRKVMKDPKTGEEREVQLGSPRRLKIIYDTNLRAAHAAGKWEQIERTKARRPFLRYVAILDDRTRPVHRGWHGTVLSADDAWWGTHYPPNGWRCRCSVQQLSQRDLDRYGYELSPEAPPSPTREWINPRTGEVRQVPMGIDPGFDYHVGKANLAHAHVVLAGKIEQSAATTPELARAALRGAVDSDDFARFVASPEGSYPVMLAPDVVREAIGARARVVVLSDESLAKNLAHHPDLTLEDYRSLPTAGEHPVLIVQDGPTTVVIVSREGEMLWSVVKATRTGDEMFVTSVRRTGPADIAKLRRRKGAKVLLDEMGGKSAG